MQECHRGGNDTNGHDHDEEHGILETLDLGLTVAIRDSLRRWGGGQA